MRRAEGEIGHYGEYDYVLINRDLSECLGEVQSIVRGERLRRNRRPYLADFVRRLVERPNN
jgi:guanylate kinase